MTVYNIVTKDNLGDTLLLGRLTQGRVDVNIDSKTIIVDSNGVLSVNPDYNYLKYETIGEQQVWEMTHNFGKKPIISVFNMDNVQLLSLIEHLDDNRVRIAIEPDLLQNPKLQNPNMIIAVQFLCLCHFFESV